MCEIFDGSWEIVLGLLLLLSISTLLIRLKYSNSAGARAPHEPPAWLSLLLFWSMGLVGLTMLLLMVLGFFCAGSPGDMTGIVPN